MRRFLIGALGLSLTGCSHPPPAPTAATSCGGWFGLIHCDRKAASPPVKLASFRTKSAVAPSKSSHSKSSHAKSSHAKSAHAKSAHAKPSHAKPSHAKSSHVKAAKPPSDHAGAGHDPTSSATTASAREKTTPIPLPRRSPQAPQSATAAAAAALSEAAGANEAAASGADRQRAAGETGSIQEQVAVATAGAERSQAAAPDNADSLVAVLIARLNITSVSDLAGKRVAIDERYSASSSMIRTAIVAAGATEVQMSEGSATAIDRMANGETPAAVVALMSPQAAQVFPDIAGFRTFRVPLSPRSLKEGP